MKTKYYLFSIADGIIRCLLFVAMLDLIVSTYSLNFSLSNYVQIGCVFSALAVIVSIVFFCRIRSKKALLIMCAISFVCFYFTCIFCWFIVPIHFFPKRTVSPAEGFLAFLEIAIFAVFMLLRWAFIALFFTNSVTKQSIRGTRGTGDGSVS